MKQFDYVVDKEERKNKLNDQQIELVIGMMLVVRDKGYFLDSSIIREFIQNNLNIKVSPAWVTRFMKKYRFSYQKVTKRSYKQFSSNYLEDCYQFIEDLRTLNKRANQLWCMDEKGLWSNETPTKTIGKKNR